MGVPGVAVGTSCVVEDTSEMQWAHAAGLVAYSQKHGFVRKDERQTFGRTLDIGVKLSFQKDEFTGQVDSKHLERGADGNGRGRMAKMGN